MKVGVTIPNHWGVSNVLDVVALAELAETLGYASVWTMDHLLNIGRVRERLQDRPYWHPLAVLSAVAMRTRSVQLGTSVMVLPYHDPVGLAKYAATLDALSHGRLILGVGVGALREEFAALGIPASRRGALTDQSIAVMKELWTRPDPDLHTGRFRLADLKFSPRCMQQPHVPLWIGGSSDAAIARCARVGDGWHPANIDAPDFARGVDALRRQADAQGRDGERIVLSLRLDVDCDEDPAPPRLQALDEQLQRYRAAGVQHLLLAFTGGEVVKLRRWMVAARPLLEAGGH